MNADIGFFDGFNGTLVGISYGVLIAFSIIFQLVRWHCSKNKKHDNLSHIDSDESNADDSMKKKNVYNNGYESNSQ